MKDVPTFTLRADDPDALQALFHLGMLKEDPGDDRQAVLDAALEFSRYQDEARRQNNARAERRLTWDKRSASKWVSNEGHQIIKYRMAGAPYYLLYQPGEPIEGGDYTRHDLLAEAKAAA